MRHFHENRRKFEQLILYISKRYGSDPLYGATRLNKVLFFADFLAYAQFGNPVTGAEYISEKRGPVPRPVRDPDRVLSRMMRAGQLRLDKKDETNWNGKRITRITPVALKDPDMSEFSAQEIGLIDDIVESFRGWRAGPISKYTHQLPQWHAVHLGEPIPYELIFVSEDQRFSEREIQHAHELAQRYGWPRSRKGR